MLRYAKEKSMLEKQKVYVEFLQKVEAIASSIEGIDLEEFRLTKLRQSVQDVELLVPVVGAFSAGKSTLINSLLGGDYLEVDSNPKTALATELRYSADKEYIEAYKKNGDYDIFGIDEKDKIEEYQRQASENDSYEFLRFYIHKEVLKEIEPMILVDMPGFDSPLEKHNTAIYAYIEKGVHFVVLERAAQGTITQSLKRNLENICNLGRDFSFFISRANQVPPSEIQDIKEYFLDQLQLEFNVTHLQTLGKDGGDILKTLVKELNANALIEKVFKQILLDTSATVIDSIYLKSRALNKSIRENQNRISDLQEAIQDLQKEQEAMIKNVENRYALSRVDSILDAVDSNLQRNIDELVTAYNCGGESTLNNSITSIIQGSLSKHIKDTLEGLSAKISKDFSVNLQNLNTSMSEFSASGDWAKALEASSVNLGTMTVKLLEKGVEAMITLGGMVGKIGAILAQVLKIVNPIIAVVISFLPQIITGLIEAFSDKDKKIKSLLLSRVIPPIKVHLRPTLQEEFTRQVKEMIAQISQNYQEQIKVQVKIIENTQEEIKSKQSDIQNITMRCEKAIQDIEKAQQIL